MKIGILTFHYCHNYGAMLQAFALSTFLKGLGHSVFFVDYKLPILVKRYKLYPPHIYKKYTLRKRMIYFFFSLFSIRSKIKRINRFKKFEKCNFPIIPVKDVRSLDMIIVGSDQVWNPTITSGYDKYYYGYFSHLGIPHIGYAVSCPAMYISKDMKTYFDNFRAIGVRETNTYNKIRNMGYKVQLTIDPTLLLPVNSYKQLITAKNGIMGKYIFVYDVSGNNLVYDVVHSLFNKEDIVIVGNMGSNIINVDYVYNDAGPNEFLGLISNSEYSFVSSFHGTVFSILFHKKFVFVPLDNEKDDRSLTLLEKLGLNGNVYHQKIDLNTLDEIDWTEVEYKLNCFRKESVDYLTHSIKSIC